MSTHSHPDTPTSNEPSNANPLCPECSGSGWVHPLDGKGNPDYGNVVPCSAPGCAVANLRKYAESAEYQEACGIRPELQTFANFKALPETKDSYAAAVQLADGTATFVWLLVFGGTGSGKSHLCNAVSRQLLSRGIQTRLVLGSEIIAQLRQGMNDHTTDEIMRYYQTVPALIIDDLGVGSKSPGERAGEWEWARIEELLVIRHEWRRVTMVATNMDWSEFPGRIKSRFDDRSVSRWVLNQAPDYRSTKSAQ